MVKLEQAVQQQQPLEDAELARATANATASAPTQPPPAMPPLLPPVQAFPARRETGPMGDRARQEDICAVCYQGEFADHNQILYCDGCNLGLHQHCANVPEVPEGEAPYWCDYCLVANAFPCLADEPPPVCLLCGGRGGGLIRAMVDKEEDEDQDSHEEPPPSPPPRFVHKTCALAGMGGSRGPVRFLAGSNGGVALVASSSSSTALRASTREPAAEAAVSPSVKTDGGDRRCRHCGSADGLLLPCRGNGGEGGCPLAAHASCAFEAAAAALVVDQPPVEQGSQEQPSSLPPPVHVWCGLEHAPPPEKANPGADAVAACLGLLPPVASQPALPPPASAPAAAAAAADGQPPAPQRRVQEPQHFRGPAALFGGYVDDKAKLLLRSRAEKWQGGGGASRVVLVGRQRQAGGGGGVQVVYALRDPGAFLPPPETPRVGMGAEVAEGAAMDTSE